MTKYKSVQHSSLLLILIIQPYYLLLGYIKWQFITFFPASDPVVFKYLHFYMILKEEFDLIVSSG